jgi:prepilin signal peptidase PulO-like enzyme (type II secretory pathway)
MGCLFLSAFTLGEGSILARSSLALFFALLLVISVVDLRSQMIPDVFNLPLIALGILYGILVAPWLSVGIAALVPVVFFGAQWIVSRGRWVGSGDILLGCALGAALHDWRLSLLGLMWAYMAGALITLPFLIAGTVGRKTHIPFGPFLALGSMLALFVGRVALEYLLG